MCEDVLGGARTNAVGVAPALAGCVPRGPVDPVQSERSRAGLLLLDRVFLPKAAAALSAKEPAAVLVSRSAEIRSRPAPRGARAAAPPAGGAPVPLAASRAAAGAAAGRPAHV